MTSTQFLEDLLKNQKLSEKETKNLKKHRDELEKLLREEFGEKPVIKFAGSKAKNTMIKESYDLDVVCYFPYTEEKSIKEIFQETKKILAKTYKIKAKTSAIRVFKKCDDEENTDYHIDVVPGKFVNEYKTDAWLYINNDQGERIQTNIKKHIKHISESDSRDIIKLIKLWSTRSNLGIRTFVLELLIIESLKYNRDSNIETKLIKSLQFIADKITTLQLVDPANRNNIVSKLISKELKEKIAEKAKKIVETIDKLKMDAENEKVVLEWKKFFKEPIEEDKNYIYPSSGGITITKKPSSENRPLTPNKAWRR